MPENGRWNLIRRLKVNVAQVMPVGETAMLTLWAPTNPNSLFNLTQQYKHHTDQPATVFRQVTAVYCENLRELLNELCGRKAGYITVEADDTYLMLYISCAAV